MWASPNNSSPCLATVLAGVALLALAWTPSTVASPPLVGGAGMARFFRGQEFTADIASARLSLPTPAVTVEFWVRLSDVYRRQLLFSYGAVDDRTSALVGHELELSVDPQRIHVVHKSTAALQVFYCQSLNAARWSPAGMCTSFRMAGWTHVALALNATSSRLKLYLNGTMVMDVPGDGVTLSAGQDSRVLGIPLVGRGTVLLGQNPTRFMDDFEKPTQTSAFLDQIRIWRTERSMEEIQAWMDHVELPVEQRSQLAVEWRLDETVEDIALEPDASGNGRPLHVGSLETAVQTVTYSSNPAMRPTHPSLVVSTAELWGGPLGAVVSAEGLATIRLRSRDSASGGLTNLTTAITRLPRYGSLYLMNSSSSGEWQGDMADPPPVVVREMAELLSDTTNGSQWPAVVYEAQEGQPFLNDSFEYTVTNGAGESATAVVLLLPEASLFPVGMEGVPEVATFEKATKFLPFAGYTRGGVPLRLEITAKPAHGTLIQAMGETTIVGGLPRTTVIGGESVGDLPEVVEDQSGFFGYVAPSHLLGDLALDSFELTWRTEDGSLSFNETISVRITAVNDKPVIRDQQATVAHGELSTIHLEGDDAENDTVYYTILDPPALGSLYHGIDGAPMRWDLNPVVLQNAEVIPPFDPKWGPSWSFQFSACPCCVAQATCSLPNVGGGGTNRTCSCNYDGYSVAQVLGEVNAFPRASTAPTAWSPFRIGEHFLIVGFQLPVYITAIKVYELLIPNRISKLSAAATYAGNETEWTVLYERAISAPVQGDVNMFDPPLCPSADTAFQYVRIDISIKTQQEMYYMIDALEILGTVEAPHGLIRGGGNSLGYRPPPGMHGDLEAVRFAARDCSNGVGEPRTLKIRVQAPPYHHDHSSTVLVGEPISVTAIIDGETKTQVPTERFASLLPKHLSRATLSHVDILFDESDDHSSHFFTLEGGDVLETDGHVVGARTSDGVFVLACTVAHMHVARTTHLRVWATFTAPDASSITFRDRVEVDWVCAPGISPAVCAIDPGDCAVLGSDWVLEPTEGRCVWEDDGKKLTVSLTVGLSFLFLTIIVAAFLQLRRLAQRAKVLQEQLETHNGSSDDLQIDPDAPLLKIMDFLDKLAYEEDGWGSRRRGLLSCCMLPGRNRGDSAADIRAQARQLYNLLTSGKSLLSPDLRGQMAQAANAVSNIPNASQRPVNSMPELARFLVDNMTNSAPEGSITMGRELSMRHVSRHTSATGLISSRDNLQVVDCSAEQVLDAFGADEGQLLLHGVGSDLTCNIFELSSASGGHLLAAVGLKVVQALQLQSVISAQHWDTFAHFLCRIEAAYRKVPYHNAIHAADVTARTGALLVRSGIWREGLDEGGRVTILAAIIAAIVHDVGHPGTNNSYQVTHCTKYAEDWNNHRVLENHSVHHAFLVLKDPQCNFTEDWGVSKFQRFRRMVISLVLATDFAEHFDYLTKFKAKVTENMPINWSEHGQAEQQLVLQVALKVADLGHCASPLKAHLEWVRRLENEYFAQGDLEAESGMPVSALMDRTKDGVNCAVSQLGFFDVVALPLFTSWVERFPDTMPLLEQANLNRRHWLEEKLIGKGGGSSNDSSIRVISSARNLPPAGNGGAGRQNARSHRLSTGSTNVLVNPLDPAPLHVSITAKRHGSESRRSSAGNTYTNLMGDVEAPSLEERSLSMEQGMLAERPTDENSLTAKDK